MRKKNVATILKKYGVRSVIAKVSQTPKIKLEKVFGCPEGCRKRFTCRMALNIHLNKVHNANYRIYLDERGRAYSKQTLRVKVA